MCHGYAEDEVTVVARACAGAAGMPGPVVCGLASMNPSAERRGSDGFDAYDWLSLGQSFPRRSPGVADIAASTGRPALTQSSMPSA
jgi:hypothetical protein